MCRLDTTSQAITRWRCKYRQLMLMGLCNLLLISILHLLCMLLYAGTHPTHGLSLSLSVDLVDRLLYVMMARAVPLWGCSRLL